MLLLLLLVNRDITKVYVKMKVKEDTKRDFLC